MKNKFAEQNNHHTPNKAPPIFDNSLYRLLIIRPLAKRIAPLFHKIGFSANGVCWLKLAFGLAGAILLSSKSASICLSGMILLQMNFLLDAVDGEVARLRGEAGKLSGEYIDKLFDHLPKTAMYFFWGYGAFRLTGSHIPLFLGAFFAAWNIYPRFCGVETLLERLDKTPEVYNKGSFHEAVEGAFSVTESRGRIDYMLTMFVHPAMNLLTLLFVIEIFIPVIRLDSFSISSRLLFLILYTGAGILNFFRKGVRFFKLLDFMQ